LTTAPLDETEQAVLNELRRPVQHVTKAVEDTPEAHAAVADDAPFGARNRASAGWCRGACHAVAGLASGRWWRAKLPAPSQESFDPAGSAQSARH
jgi:hypothetical protein